MPDSGKLGGLTGCLADMAGVLAGWLVACGPALTGPAHGQRMCCLLDERCPRLHERAVILLGQELHVFPCDCGGESHH